MSSAQDITLTAQEQDLITRLKSFRVPVKCYNKVVTEVANKI